MANFGSFNDSDVARIVDEKLGPVVDKISETHRQTQKVLADLSQPHSASGVSPASALFGGGAPGIRTGESSLTSRGYSYIRAAGYRMGYLSAEKCKVELDVHNRLDAIYDGLQRTGNSLLVPYGSRHLSTVDSDLGAELSAMCRQSVAGADRDEIAFYAQKHPSGAVRQTLSQWDDSAGGSFVGIDRGEMIELVRAVEVMSRAGSREVSFGPSGRMLLPTQSGSATAYWVGESQSITESEPTTDQIMLVAKKVAGLVTVPNELFRFSTPSFEQLVRDDLAMTIGTSVDQRMISGSESAIAIKGVLNYDINSVTASTTAADGDTLGPEDLGNAVAEVESDNHQVDSFAWIMRPKLWWQILNKRVDVLNSGDGLGGFVFAVNREDITRGAPQSLLGYPVHRSTNVPANREKGSATDLTLLIGGVFRNWLIARAGVLEFAVSTQGDTGFSKDQSKIRAVQHIDAACLRPSAFVKIDTLLETV